MRYLTGRSRGLWRLFPLWITIGLLLAMAVPTAVAENGDYAMADGWFFSQTGGGQGQGYSVRDTGTDSGGKTIKFWTEFQRLGGVATLGYPVGQPYVGSDGFTYQAFQRAILQWRPESGQALLGNSFELLSWAGHDDWLLLTKGVPKPIADDGSAGDFGKAVATRLSWLTDPAIKAKFLANPNPAAAGAWNQDRSIQLYGLPMSRPEQHGPFVVQRFQRISFQLWVENVAGMPAKGSVVGVLAGDLVKEAGLLPASAIAPLGAGGFALLQPTPTQPAPTPVPTLAYPWRLVRSYGDPNCGTTYVRAFVKDTFGNGLNGMTIKSWNDWGNEYIASTRNNNGQDGYWDRVMGSGPLEGKWYAMVIDGSGRQSSEIATMQFTANCDPNNGPAVQEVELEFRPG